MASKRALKVVSNVREMPLAAAVAGIEETATYWTPDRMEAAEPLPMPEVFPAPTTAAEANVVAATLDAEATGEVFVAPMPPDDEDVAAALASGGFNTIQVPNLDAYPYKVTGKLFMRFGATDYVGSASVIGERAIFTAGHCVYDPKLKKYADKVLFAVGYKDGQYLKAWSLPQLITLDGWKSQLDGGFPYDMAVGLAGEPIRPTTGKIGYMFNIASVQNKYLSIGYPAQAAPGFAFNGQRMWRCEGDYIEGQPVNGTGIIAMANNMTGGCSGGPVTMQANGFAVQVGVNSFRYVVQPNILRSPYFGPGFVALINWMKQNGGDT